MVIFHSYVKLPEGILLRHIHVSIGDVKPRCFPIFYPAVCKERWIVIPGCGHDHHGQHQEHSLWLTSIEVWMAERSSNIIMTIE